MGLSIKGTPVWGGDLHPSKIKSFPLFNRGIGGSMARPIWKGHISFGLVNIPVTLFSGEKRADLQFRLLDSRNQARVRYERVNEVTGEEVPWDEIVKGYEFDEGNYVLLTDEDFEKAAVENTQTVEIEDFVDEAVIEYAYFDKPYILVPGKKGDKGYVLLRETLRKTNKVGIAKVVIRSRQHLAAVIASGDALILELMRFVDELRDPSEFDLPNQDLDEYKITKKELDMAERLVESMTAEWEPEKYHDDYREALLKWIEDKMKADGHVSAPQPDKEEGAPAGEIVDFMTLLRKSVEETGSGKRSSKTKSKAKSSSKTKSKSKAKPKSKRKKQAS
jgi:DNA end-binding protein Ku